MNLSFKRVKNASSEEVTVAGLGGIALGYVVMGTGAIAGKTAVVTVGTGLLLIGTGVAFGGFISTVYKEMKDE